MRNAPRLILAIWLLAVWSIGAMGADLTVVTVTVTNTPADGNTFTVNGNIRTWKTTVTSSSTQILIGADNGETATNLFRHVAQHPYAGPLTVQHSSTNGIRLISLPSQSLAVSKSGTWASLVTTTSSDAPGYAVRVPMASQEPIASQRTNITDLLVEDLEAYPDVKFSEAAPLLSNFANLTQSQSLSNKTLTHWVFTLYDSTGTNLLTQMAGNSAGFPVLTDTNGVASDYAADAATLNKLVLNGQLAKRLFFTKDGTNTWTGTNTFGQLIASYLTALGGVLSNVTLIVPDLTNATTHGTFTMASDLSYSRVNYSSLASGGNAAVNFGAQTIYVKLKAGPTSDFSLDGVVGGRNGRVLVIQNATGSTITINDESGIEPTPANRILTRTGQPVALTGAGMFLLFYDSESSRWRLFEGGGNGGSIALGPFTPGAFLYAADSVTPAAGPLLRFDENTAGFFDGTNTFSFGLPGGVGAVTSTGDLNFGYDSTGMTFCPTGLVPFDDGVQSLGTEAKRFLNASFAGTNFVYGFTDGTGNNFARLATYSTGTNGSIVMDSQSAGIAGDPRPFAFATNGVPFLSVQPSGSGSFLSNVSGGIVGIEPGPISGSALNVYGEYTDSLNWSRLGLASDPSLGVSIIKPEYSGTGTATQLRVYFDSFNSVIDFVGAGSPEGVVASGVGSTFRRSDGGAGTSFYVKESGSGNTGWVAK